MRSLTLAGILAGLAALQAGAAPIVDGSRDAEYGAPRAVQTVETQFGDNFNELNASYGLIDGDTLYLLLTGNIEANFNTLEIFIDSKAGGQSTFDSADNGNADAMDGLVFDAGFSADYHVFVRRGSILGNDTFDLDFADLGAASADSYLDVLGGIAGSGTTGTGVNAVAIEVAFDNSNVAGVVGGTDAADPVAAAAVTTGLELGIALSDLGWTAGPIRVMAAVNNGDHNYWSNQFLRGLPAPQGNLGGDEMGGFTGEGAIDLTHFAGNQFLTVTEAPEPARIVLLGSGLAVLVAFSRRARAGAARTRRWGSERG